MADIEKIASMFLLDGEYFGAECYGNGHINDTYKVVCKQKDSFISYIIQRINHKVFTDVDALMSNITGITEFIKLRMQENNEDTSRALTIIKTIDNKSYYKDSEDGFFRCHNFIKDSMSIETAPTKKQMYISGVGYGRFQKYLNGYPIDKLKEPIPDFHNTVKRLAALKTAIAQNRANKVDKCLVVIDEYLKREHYACRIVDLLNSGAMPKRVTHNDTKLNNILIDVKKEEAIAAIDLDTVMPGSIVYDFGDSIRSGANLGEEDDQNLDNVRFSFSRYDAFSSGFLGEVKDILTANEVENMAFGAILMTYECGMRFLTDHLNGDLYFKIHRNNHNLDRACAQMKLLTEMEQRLDEMKDLVYNYTK